MPVTASSYALEHEQADGSRWCRETHQTDGDPIEFYYLLAPGDDAEAIMNDRAAALNVEAAQNDGE